MTDYAIEQPGLVELLGEFFDASLPVNAHSLALEASRLGLSGAGFLFSFSVLNTNASAQFIQLHDSIKAPGSGAVPSVVYTVAGSSNLVVAYTVPGRPFAQGLWIVNSSTSATLTAGSADCFFDLQVIPAGML